MKKLFLIVIAVLLCASFAEAYVYRTIGTGNVVRSNYISGGVITGVTGRAVESGLGAAQFAIHPFTIDNKAAGTARPGTPLVGTLTLRKRVSGSPPITEGATIYLAVIYPTGRYELYGTEDVPDILPSNVIRYDMTEEVWTTDKLVAGAEINSMINYLLFIRYEGESRHIEHTLKVK